MDETAVPLGPEELWDDGGETLWLRADLVDTRSQARYLAWNGRREGTRYTLEGDPFRYALVGGLTDLKVTKQYLRDTSDGDPYEEYPWLICKADDEGAVAYWRVTV